MLQVATIHASFVDELLPWGRQLHQGDMGRNAGEPAGEPRRYGAGDLETRGCNFGALSPVIAAAALALLAGVQRRVAASSLLPR